MPETKNMNDNELQVGDRVSRSLLGETKFGVITEVCPGAPNGLGQRLTFYTVQWDGAPRPDRGHMRQFLVRTISVPTAIAAW